jgi:UBX domain-containing protein 1
LFSGEDYAPPPKKVEYFSGSGNSLGVITSKVTEIKEDVKFSVDENQPFTEIRIRLGNGKTVVGKFNHTHTIGDLKKYVGELTNLPLFQFELMNSFPKEIFKDDNKTIKDAGLIKGNILQKLN